MSQSKGLLRQFVDVKKNEIEPALLFFSLWFLLILVFQILRPLKAGLFIENLGAYWELYAKLTNIGVAVVAMAVFTALYNRLGSLRLLKALCGFFIVALLSFAVALREGTPSPLTNWLFYLFGDAWSTIWVTTFWAYLNEMTKTEQSKRLYGFIGGGGVLGGLVGKLACLAAGKTVWIIGFTRGERNRHGSGRCFRVANRGAGSSTWSGNRSSKRHIPPRRPRSPIENKRRRIRQWREPNSLGGPNT